MRFESPWALLLLLLIPFVVWLYVKISGSGGLRFPSIRQAAQAPTSIRVKMAALPVWLRVLVLVLLAVCLARPQAGTEQIRDVNEGIAIEMVVDRSSSMGAEMMFDGARVNRLQAVKQVFKEFVFGNQGDLAGRPNDLIGMVTFGRYADTIAPLTLAHGALDQFLDSVDLVKRKSEDGTAIGDAIALAAARLKKAEETLAKQNDQNKTGYEIKSKMMILLTDGQNNAGERSPMDAARLAKEWGIKIYTIGVGGDDPASRQQGLLGRFLSMAGRGVDTKTLKAVAETSGGVFRMAEDADSLRAVYAEIDKMEKTEIEAARYMDYRELFQPLALVALGFLTLEILLATTVFRRIP